MNTMEYNTKLQELALKLYDIDAVKFGDFMTKSGIKTPVYFDLRVIVSYPDIMDLITTLIYDLVKYDKWDHFCGVPYTALPIATLLSVKAKVSMLMRRKEAKGYGTKKMIEGHFKRGQTCLIIEDVVTSGSSVLETAKDLQKEGLVSSEVIVILDREQGGRQNLILNEIEMKSLFTMTKLIDILLENGKITKGVAVQVENYLKDTKAPKGSLESNISNRSSYTYEERAQMASNPISKQIFEIMATKKTNLCLSVDLTSTTKILNLLEKVGEHICLVKTHVDIIDDFSDDFVHSLKQLANRFNFLILEDRKFADIGNTVNSQYLNGIYKIGQWADCVTVHSIPGEGILKALTGVCKGVFLLAQMSSEGNLINQEYTEATVKMAEKYSDLMTGFVCQKKEVFNNSGLIQLTPGVQLESSTDNLGQVYNTPEKVVLENGADVVVVGRGIVTAKCPETEVVLYKDRLWKCYMKRISNKVE